MDVAFQAAGAAHQVPAPLGLDQLQLRPLLTASRLADRKSGLACRFERMTWTTSPFPAGSHARRQKN